MKLEALHAHTERLLERITGIPQLSTDDQGEWLHFPFERSVVHVRVLDHEAPRVFVYAIAAVEVPESLELFRDLNDMNSRLTYCRAYWSKGTVYVEIELVGETLDRAELENAFFAVGHAADHFGPRLAVEHGGDTPLDGAASGDTKRAEERTGLYL